MKSSRFATVESLTLFAPALDGLWPAGTRLPGVLGRMLDRGRLVNFAGGFSPARLVGLPEDAVPGAAALSRRIDRPDDIGGVWVRADPVRLDADIDAVWFAEHAPPELPGDRRAKLAAAITELVATDGLDFDWPHPRRAYLRLPESPDTVFTDPRNAVGQRLDNVLPEGTQAGRWRGLINELQMLMHGHIRPGEANALWLWGAGDDVPAPVAPPLDGMAVSEADLRGLADWLGIPVRPPGEPGESGRWLAQWRPDPEQDRDANYRLLEQHWLQPAWRNLVRGRLRQFTLATETRAVRLTRRGRLAFWRRAR